jgi:hypothetical protein
LEKSGTNGKTDGTDLRIGTDFFYEKARVSRKKRDVSFGDYTLETHRNIDWGNT